MSGYIGTQPVPQATQTRDVFTATSGQTSFATSGYTPNFLDVWLNGVKLVNGDDFTATNGSDVVLTTGATAGDTVEVLSYSTFEIANLGTAAALDVGTAAGDVVQLDGSARLPSVDGSQLTGISSIPTGVIVMWSGSVANVPSGWAICNGLNGTPNLTGRFVVHADADAAGTYNVGDTGGASTVALTAAQMASHTHNFAANATTAGGGDHAHNGTTSNIGNHTHTIGNGQMDKYAGWANVSAWPVFSHSRSGPYSTSGAGSHSHNFTTGNSGNHTHNLSVSGATGSTGTGDAHENRPPYYALAYIMKL